MHMHVWSLSFSFFPDFLVKPGNIKAWTKRDSSFHHFIIKTGEWLTWMNWREEKRRCSFEKYSWKQDCLSSSQHHHHHLERKDDDYDDADQFWMFVLVFALTLKKNHTPLALHLRSLRNQREDEMDSSNLSMKHDDDGKNNVALIPWLMSLLLWSHPLRVSCSSFTL